MKKYFILGLIGIFAGCTDAELAQYGQLGSSQEITCYSGGVVIYHGYSTGKVLAEQGGSGHYFQERDTGDLVEILGNCIIRSAHEKRDL